jgi:hypothetical protein
MLVRKKILFLPRKNLVKKTFLRLVKEISVKQEEKYLLPEEKCY